MKSSQSYLDFICRDGFITEAIGEYLHLEKENILGGNDYHSDNDNFTHIPIYLDRSNIHLGNSIVVFRRKVKKSIFFSKEDNRVDLVTCFVVLHHVPQLRSMLLELVRILRLNAYLIIREHDCQKEHSLTSKYLNFVHAFMRIAQVGEYAHQSLANQSNDWKQLKTDILNDTSAIQYRTQKEGNRELRDVGFTLITELDDIRNQKNPQVLYHTIYQ